MVPIDKKKKRTDLSAIAFPSLAWSSVDAQRGISINILELIIFILIININIK